VRFETPAAIKKMATEDVTADAIEARARELMHLLSECGVPYDGVTAAALLKLAGVSPQKAVGSDAIEALIARWREKADAVASRIARLILVGCADELATVKSELVAALQQAERWQEAALAATRRPESIAPEPELSVIAGLVNSYYRDDRTPATETVRAIADALGQPVEGRSPR